MPETIKPANRLLAALPAKEYQLLLSKMEEVSLIYGENIYEQGEIIRSVYFPNSGTISLLTAVEERSRLAVGMVGNEGIIGLNLFLGGKISNYRAIVQGEGFAMRMKAADFLAECENGGLLPNILRRYTLSLLAQVSQSAVCNRFHLIEARVAHWLLMTADRMETNQFKITHEFLSNMLGVRREAVSQSAVILQRQQLISYSRGNISINNRTGLESASCRCYTINKNEEYSLSAE